MQPYYSEKFYNPSAGYLAAQAVSKDLEAARATVAQILGARPIEVTFTAGGSEANNIAIRGVLEAFPGSKVIVSAIEHDSVLEAAKQYDHSIDPVLEHGVFDLGWLRESIDDDTVLLSFMYANNEIGTIEPIAQIADMVAEVRKARKQKGNPLPLYLHTDAAQAGNYLDIHVSRLGVDLMSLNGGKIYGPKQSGALYVRSGVQLKPLVYGGGQEHGLRSGTENVAGAIGFATALKRTQSMRAEETRRLKELQDYFFFKIHASFPGAVVNGWLKKRLPNNVHVTFPGADNERLIYGLDERGIMAAAGSACSASSEESSHVLKAIGLTDEDARASLRFTMGRMTAKEDIDTVVDALSELLA
jgi:cysteine desulfurase